MKALAVLASSSCVTCPEPSLWAATLGGGPLSPTGQGTGSEGEVTHGRHREGQSGLCFPTSLWLPKAERGPDAPGFSHVAEAAAGVQAHPDCCLAACSFPAEGRT